MDVGAIVNGAGTAEQHEWDEIVRRDGLTATLVSRDKCYAQRLGG
jgi:hypothetical protein